MSKLNVISSFLNQILSDNQHHMEKIDPNEYKKFEKFKRRELQL